MSVEPIPRREIVTRSPRRARRIVPGPPAPVVRDQPVTDDPDLRVLMRRQLRSSLAGLAALVIPTALLPILLPLVSSLGGPGTGSAVTWVVLGFCGYPPLVLLAWWYVRRAERHERDHCRLAKGD
jgi:hypothetical protein